jgi:nucleoid-associated protein YgaU
MIERVSRYYDGPLTQTPAKYTGEYVISVFRKFPNSVSVNYISYTWKEGDTLSHISERYGIGAKYWWEIMEINPEISDPFNISPGAILRVPYGN